jgi:hypothetical protein
MSDANALLQRLLVGYLANAKAELDAAQYDAVAARLPAYLAAANDMVSIEVLVDRAIMRQAIHALAAGNSLEETLMFTFMLYIYKLVKGSSGHPLETGIIRQKIIGLLPWFENAADSGLIREAIGAPNAALLMSIADKTEDMAEALQTLAAGYDKFAQ